MFLTLSTVGLLALAAREAGLRKAGRMSGRAANLVRSVLEIGGGMLVLGFAVALLV
ncbi:MAG: hypothetical protein JNG85_13925 [Spirochaetaceae bacterium]|nr:hypothetical protein [Spirochaetaceae bacterium]